jgi:hypothetical protein
MHHTLINTGLKGIFPVLLGFFELWETKKISAINKLRKASIINGII